jgi:hypothetical protein
MRRIIERVVTVVTTTTWKISWEADPPPPGPQADAVSLPSSDLEIAQSTPPRPTTTKPKEVDESVTNDSNETKGG